jgi:hypothetical protein
MWGLAFDAALVHRRSLVNLLDDALRLMAVVFRMGRATETDLVVQGTLKPAAEFR